MEEMNIVIDYSDMRYGIVHTEVPERFQERWRKLLKQKKYRTNFASDLDLEDRDDRKIAFVATLMRGIRQLLLQILHEANRELNIRELAFLALRPYSYVHKDINALRELGVVTIKRHGRASTITLRAKITPCSQYLKQKIEHPEKEVVLWKQELVDTQGAEEGFKRRMQNELYVLAKFGPNARSLYLSKAQLRR